MFSADGYDTISRGEAIGIKKCLSNIAVIVLTDLLSYILILKMRFMQGLM